MTNTIRTTEKVTDLKVGDSYFTYGVEQRIIEVIVEGNKIHFESHTGGDRTFNNHLTTKAIVR
tara:strand:+ start:817 stop:1005 length:189 start_codon:yes stop_codon:yes gene_type:complete